MNLSDSQDEPASAALQRQLYLLAEVFCVHVEKYSQQRNKHNLIALETKTSSLCQLANFIDNKRLRPFCKEIESYSALLSIRNQDEIVVIKTLLQAGLLLCASLRNPVRGVQEDCLAVAAFDSLRALRGAVTLVPSIRKLAIVVPPSTDFWCCLRRKAKQALNLMEADDSARIFSSVLGCFAQFSGEKIKEHAKSDNVISTLLYIEMRSADSAYVGSQFDSQRSTISGRGIFVGQSRVVLLLVLQHRILALIARCDTISTHCLLDCAQTVRQAMLAIKFLENNSAFKDFLNTLEISRVYLRHLQCWGFQSPDAIQLLFLCLLKIEACCRECFEPRSKTFHKIMKPSQLKARCDKSIHDVRYGHHQCDPIVKRHQKTLSQIFESELIEIDKTLRGHAGASKFGERRVYVDTNVYEALCRLSAGALCMGDLMLYEISWWVQSLYSLAIERRIHLRIDFVNLLPHLVDIAEDTNDERRRLAQRRLVGLLTNVEDATVQARAAHPDGLSIFSEDVVVHAAPSEQLAIFLSENIRELIVYPEKLKGESHQVRQLVIENRRCILELNMLSAGARALNVDRVAALSEALGQVHSALCALPGTINSIDLQALLSPGHQLLRECLNRAAARQHIEDVRGVVAELYQFLETGLPVVATKWRRRGLRQRSRQLVAQLNSSLGTLEALTHTQAMAAIARAQPLLGQLVAEQRSLVQQMQEELDESQRVRFGRVRARLQRFVARQANAMNKPVCLQIRNEALQFRRETIASVIVPLHEVLKMLIVHSVEESSLRRLRSKPKEGVISLVVHNYKGGISLELSDDGQEITSALVRPIEQQLQAMGGDISNAYLPLQGNRLKIRLAD